MPGFLFALIVWAIIIEYLPLLLYYTMFLFALIVWAIIGTIKENRAINRGEIPCRQCFACTRRWMFEDSRRNLNEVGLRRYIEMNEIEICEYRRKELYGEDEK
jgi:hypothetical protein